MEEPTVARQQANSKENEHITVLGTDDHEVELPPVDDASTAVIVADATTKVAPEVAPEEVPPVHRYTVVADKQILSNGFRTTLKAGKIVDSLNYDIKHLKKQGVRLQRVETEPDDE